MIRKFYFMGIKGVGMATLAVMAKQAGFVVAGSDIEEEFITDKILDEANLKIYTGFKGENVEDFFGALDSAECLLIATGAHDGFDNPEVIYAEAHNIKVISHGEAVGLFMSGKLFDRELYGISVAGSHGKTTITSLIAALLTKLNQDPSFTAGTSEIVPIGAAGHYGRGKYFVAEADEYVSEINRDRRPKFYHQVPKALIINNIDFDHPDFYENIDAVVRAFRIYIEDLPSDTLFVINGDDGHIKSIFKNFSDRKVITYGSGAENDYIVKNFVQNGFSSEFDVYTRETNIGKFTLSIPGFYNAKNSLAAIALLIDLGFSVRDIAGVMPEFKGGKRRLEQVGHTQCGQLLLDDYGHHPEEIRKTIRAVKSAFPDKKLVTVFQPHTFLRTKSLEHEFISALSLSDSLILLSTFASQRHDADHDNYDEKFTEKFRQINKSALLLKSIDSVVEYLDSNVRDANNIILTMGAGDVYKVAYSLISK